MSTEENALASGEHEDTTTPAAVENAAETTEPEKDSNETDAGTSADGEKDGSDADGESQKKPNRVSAKDRISELTRQKREAIKRAEVAEAKLKSLETPAPKRSQYSDDDEFDAARAKWAVKAARGDEAQTEAETAKAEARQAKAEAWNAQREDILSRHADFDQVIAAVPNTIFTEAVADAITESEMAADVAYVLAKDLKRAREFAAMTPLQQGREIGRIEAELSPKPRKLSSAPPPVETIGSKGPGNTPDPEKMSMDEYARWRKSQKD